LLSPAASSLQQQQMVAQVQQISKKFLTYENLKLGFRQLDPSG
jgi:hypothetical protein